MNSWIETIIDNKIELLKKIKDIGFIEELVNIGYVMERSISGGNKIMLAGNGGSAADAQHFSAELIGRFTGIERPALASIALGTEVTTLTSIANDYDYNSVFTRQIQGIGKGGDVLVVISTSGNSSNLVNAVKKAALMGITTVGLLGKDGGELKKLCDYSLVVPIDMTPRIQEIHTLCIHILCEMIEKDLFQEKEE